MCTAVLAGCSAAATSTGTASPAGAPSAPPSAVASDRPAAAVQSSTGLQGATLNAVAASGEGMVAVGAGTNAAAWTSTDGVAWQPVEVAGADDADALHAVGFDGDGVAFGAVDPEPSRVWSASAGSQPWQPADSDGIDGRVNAVAVGADRWVAAGDLVDAESGSATGGAVWTSDDGRQWASLAELPLNEGTISDVVIAGDTVVVVGFDLDGGKAWTSVDGGDLEAVDGDAFATATIQGVAHTNAGYVALGRTLGDLRPVAWTSDDAVTWSRHDLPAAAFAPDLQINDLATVDGVLVAVGAAPEGGAVWTSDDGASWTLHVPGAGATENAS
jgi:hypothetical protein